MRSSLVVALLSVLAIVPRMGAAEEAPTDPFVYLQQIREVFLEGNYEAVERLAGRLLESSPSVLVRAETLQYLGASLELLGRTDAAEENFDILLTLQPEFHMNQADFPTEVIRLFESVRLRVQDRINQIDERRRRAQDAVRRERERRLMEQQRQLVEAARTRYVVRDLQERHLIVSFLPFGAGQFQNGMRRRGYAFMGAQLGLMSASMVVWLLGTLAPENPEDREQAEQLLLGYQISSWALVGTLAVAVVWGIVDALVNHRRGERSRETWREIEEDEVPEEHRINVNPQLLELQESLGTPRNEPTPGAN